MKEKKHLLKLLFGTTLCIVMLLGIALSVPGYTAHAEEEKEELFYTFSEELDKTETSAACCAERRPGFSLACLHLRTGGNI